MLRAMYSEAAMKKCAVFKQHKRFRKGRKDVKDDGMSEHPKTHPTRENVEKYDGIQQLVKFGRWQVHGLLQKN